MKVIFDIECFSNYFLAVFYDLTAHHVFEISQFKNQYAELKEFCKKVTLYIGFNNRDYDCPMLEAAISGTSYSDLHLLSNDIIVNKKRHYTRLPYIDLMIVNHYGIGSPKTSNLKKLSFNYRNHEVYDMPVDYTKPVIESKRKPLEKYCIKDTLDTHRVYQESREKLEIRRDLSKLFGIDVRNMADPSMVEAIFMKELRLDKKEIMKSYVEYDKIVVKDLILDYIGEGTFTTIAKQFFNSIVLKPTASGFKSNDDILHKTYTNGDITIKWAMGGVHGVVDKGLYTNDEYSIVTCDGASMYPNYVINNKVYPKTIGIKALELYSWFKTERFKYPKGSTLNLGFKLFINLFSGKLKQKFSPLYEPKGNIAMVINCQLLITWLADMIIDAIPNARLIMINTDGLEIAIPKDSEDTYKQVCKKWENITRYQLEYDKYKQLFIRDVNNYHGIFENGKVKRKGCFETYQDIVDVKDYHKNTSMNIVPLAINEYLVNNTPIEGFVKNHKDIFDFFLGENSRSTPKKGKPKFLLTTENEFGVTTFDTFESRFLRYYAAKDIGKNKYTLSKIYPDQSVTNVHTNTKIRTCEKLKINYDISTFDINYEWYINEINKIMNCEE